MTASSTHRPNWAATLLTAATMFAFMDIARITFPSIAFIYGRAGSTPATEMGLFALVLFGTAGLLARTAGINVAVSAPIAVAGTIVARLTLVALPGGTTQLLAASLGLISVVALLGALAASDLPLRAAARGLALGVLASVTVHTMLGTVDSIWIGGGLGWLVAVAVVGALGWSWWMARPTSERPDVRSTLPWLLVGPIVALMGIAASTPGALRAAWGESLVLPAVLLVLAATLGVVAGRVIMSSFTRDFGAAIVMVPAALSAALLIATDSAGPSAVAALLVAFVSTMSFTVSGETVDDSLASRGRRSAAPAGGMALAFLIVFGYYASYEIVIGFPRGVLPAAAAALIGSVIFRLQPSDKPDALPSKEDIGTLLFAPFLVLFVVMASQAQPNPAPFDASLGEVRVMTWNIHMGYDTDGIFDPDAIAKIIGEQQPDVLVLNEVDRGWLLAGGHDLLTILAQELRMDYAFGQAADAIWGNAILSRHPIENVVVETLPGDAAMNRSVMSAEIVLGEERLGVIATHLHHLDDGGDIRLLQTQRVADIAQAMQLRAIPVVILGDFNEQPGSNGLLPLANFTDLVALAADGASTATFPSNAPARQIDHIFASRGFGATAMEITRTTASDHLPVAVTIGFAEQPTG